MAQGQVDTEGLKSLLARHPLADGQPIYAVDVTTWPRCDAEASPDRGFYYHPSRHSAGQPIVAGWAYQLISQLGFARDSWTAPMDTRRLHPSEEDDAVAVEQIKALIARLPAQETVPWFVFDTGYNSVELAEGLRDTPVALLVRLRSDRCFYADPPRPRSGQAAPVAMVPSSPSRTPRRGRSRATNSGRKTSSMARCESEPGRACTLRPRTTRPAGPTAHVP